MSVRENDGKNNDGSSRGVNLALAAIAVGVGVGAALYHVFKKQPEEQQCDGPWTSGECSICFDPITIDQQGIKLPCKHLFHRACILPWIQQRNTCPNCRGRV